MGLPFYVVPRRQRIVPRPVFVRSHNYESLLLVDRAVPNESEVNEDELSRACRCTYERSDCVMTVMPAVRPKSRALAAPSWLAFVGRRGSRFVVSLWVLMSASFLMLHLIPGDPVRLALGRSAPAATVALRRKQLGLDDPLFHQYVSYFKSIFSGDFGTSMVTGLPVSDVIGARLPATLELAIGALVVMVVVSVPLGTFFAIVTRAGRRQRTEMGFAAGSIIVGAVPSFLTGTVLVAVFAVALGWVPAAGRDGWTSAILPIMALAIAPIAILARVLRVELLAILDKDFVRTARAKRLTPARIYFLHALPNACTATLTLAGLMFSSLVAGTVLVENVFAWPGLGSSIVTAIQQKDYPLVQAIVLLLGAIVLVTNLVVDGLLAVLDPRSLIREA